MTFSVLDWLFFLFISIFFIVVFGFWIYYERRDNARRVVRAISSSFHCKLCSQIYEVSGNQTEAPCPKCEHSNLRLRF
ncbi:MAG: hydrogenase nickel incorporation protein HypA [Opitutales bacterium]|nr:hydrogenase nickel incorporation protein HypA [Opitutales bacterium]